MADPLAVYLNDHLAGAKSAIELLDRLRNAHHGNSLGELADRIYSEVEADREVLERLSEAVGTGGSAIKEAGAWLAERAARLKLRLGSDAELGEFESLEFLALGIFQKRKLWAALSSIAHSNSHLQQLDYDKLISRADAQHDDVENYRLIAAQKALTGGPRGDANDQRFDEFSASQHSTHFDRPGP